MNGPAMGPFIGGVMYGTFIFDLKNLSLYIIGKSGKWMYLVCNSQGQLASDIGPKTAYDSKFDTIATNTEVDAFKQSRSWPKWVEDILTKSGKTNTGITNTISLPASVAKVTDKYNITTPAQPKRAIDPTATLLTFRAQCPHKWLKYVGAVRAYEFCEYCDLKRGF